MVMWHIWVFRPQLEYKTEKKPSQVFSNYTTLIYINLNVNYNGPAHILNIKPLIAIQVNPMLKNKAPIPVKSPG